ncbi:MAG: glycosyltransferase [Candidatus Sumerlaeota bacterium]|nr:glycosyltransferase [Candidatus Sumerlaeota bacterium]
MTLDISIIILTANRLPQLQRLLEALARQSPKPREILVMDNGSRDGTSEWLASSAPERVRAIAGREDIAFAEARNHAVAQAGGAWVAFIDDDCLPAPGWLRRAGELAEVCDVAGGPVVAYQALPNPEWFDPEMGWAIGLSTGGAFTPEAGYTVLPQTANLIVRREILLKHPFQVSAADGGASATFAAEMELAKYAAGREDAEIWMRLRIQGFRTRFDPALVVLHDIPADRVDRDYAQERMRQDARAAAARSQPPRYLERALNDVAAGYWPEWTSDEHATASAFWRERQREYLKACRALGEPLLQGTGLTLQLLKTWASQTVGDIKRKARQTLLKTKSRDTRSESMLQIGALPPVSQAGKPVPLVVAARGYIGDMVILAPMLSHLKKSLPTGSELTLITTPRIAQLYQGLDVADKISLCDESSGHEALQSKLGTRNSEPGTPEAELGTRNSELGTLPSKPAAIFVPYWHDESPVALFKMGAPVVTFDREVGFVRQWWYDRADVCVRKDFEVNELVNLTRLFACLGIEGPPPPIQWPRDEQAAQKAERLLREARIPLDAPLVGIHFDATHPEKQWPLERWAELLKRLAARFPSHHFMLTGPSDQSAPSDQLIREHFLKAHNFCGKDDLRSFAELARRMRLFIATDSGPRHLAAAVGCPTVTLYGWTDPRRWGAFYEPEKHIALCSGDPIMTPEEMHGHPQLAIRRISVDMVFEAVERRLSS